MKNISNTPLLLFLLLFLLLVSCASPLTDKQRNTIFVANDYLIYQEKYYQSMSELVSIFNCENSVNVFISPLIHTKKERFSKASAHFMTICGEPQKISIMFENNLETKADIP